MVLASILLDPHSVIIQIDPKFWAGVYYLLVMLTISLNLLVVFIFLSCYAVSYLACFGSLLVV